MLSVVEKIEMCKYVKIGITVIYSRQDGIEDRGEHGVQVFVFLGSSA